MKEHGITFQRQFNDAVGEIRKSTRCDWNLSDIMIPWKNEKSNIIQIITLV